jgi:RNA polymerase sigma factor (sigma-70 family)
MITITKPLDQDIEAHENERFVAMLPRIRQLARRAFRRLRPELKEDVVQEVIANAYCAFVRLVGRGKADVAYATPLATFAILQVIGGRQVGTKLNRRDVLSPRARAAGEIIVERLDEFDHDQGDWRAALLEDRRATPADTAAARIDVAAWLRSLPDRSRRIATMLAMGESTRSVSRQFNLSSARISQLREELKTTWERFHEPLQSPT